MKSVEKRIAETADRVGDRLKEHCDPEHFIHRIWWNTRVGQVADIVGRLELPLRNF